MCLIFVSEHLYFSPIFVVVVVVVVLNTLIKPQLWPVLKFFSAWHQSHDRSTQVWCELRSLNAAGTSGEVCLLSLSPPNADIVMGSESLFSVLQDCVQVGVFILHLSEGVASGSVTDQLWYGILSTCAVWTGWGLGSVTHW